MDSHLEPTISVPPQVVVALFLIGVDFLLSIALIFGLGVDVPFTTQLVTATLLAAFFLLWMYGLYRRLNWLRWLTVGLAILGVLCLPWAWRILQSRGDFPLGLLKYVLFDSAGILLGLPQANRWYARRATTA